MQAVFFKDHSQNNYDDTFVQVVMYAFPPFYIFFYRQLDKEGWYNNSVLFQK